MHQSPDDSDCAAEKTCWSNVSISPRLPCLYIDAKAKNTCVLIDIYIYIYERCIKIIPCNLGSLVVKILFAGTAKKSHTVFCIDILTFYKFSI